VEMGKCIYTIKDSNGEIKNMDLLQLTEYYLKDSDKFKKSKIFSSEEKINATVKIINTLTDNNYRKSLKEDTSKTEVTEFITKELPTELLDTLGLVDQNRLNPEYIEQNRIIEYIKTGLNSSDDTPILPEHETLKDYVNLKEFSKYSKEKINYYLVDILDTITLEEKVKKLGVDIHKALKALVVQEGDFSHPIIKNILNSMYEKNLDILDGNKNAWVNKFKEVLIDLYSVLRNYGYLTSEIPVGTKNEESIGQLKGIIDIVAIDNNGNPQIFDLKLSKKPFRNWDSVKLQQTD
jgi:hypothetical protein